jgi:uncharacterized protein
MQIADLLQDQNPWWGDAARRRARAYPVRRDLQPEILKRLDRADRRALLLLGPRQVGKTVLLLQLADDLLDAGFPPGNLLYFDFSDDRIQGTVTAREVSEIRPEGLDPERPRVFLFDEIHLAESWDRWLKQAVDAGIGRIVATDSAASLLRDGARESGQGRWDEEVIEGLSLAEFVRFNADPEEPVEATLRRLSNLPERYLALGGFPEHALAEDFPEVRRRLRSDIAERAILRDLAGRVAEVEKCKDLFVYLVQSSGAELNAAARSRDLGVDARTIQSWAALLEETLLVRFLERHTRSAAAGLRSRSKVYAADPGLVAAFALIPVGDPEVRGRAFEAAVFRHLREEAHALGGKLGYFRPGDDLEIDFVVEVGDRRVGVEVTGSSRIKPEKLERLRRAGEVLGAADLFVVYGGVVEEDLDGIRAIPLRTFLLEARHLLAGEDDG